MVLQKLRTFSCRIKISLSQLRKGIIIVYYDQEITNIISRWVFYYNFLKLKVEMLFTVGNWESIKKVTNLKITQNSAI